MYRLIVILIIILCGEIGHAQDYQSITGMKVYIRDGDTVLGYHLPPVTVHSTAIGKGKRVVRKRNKLRYNVYKVYPYVLTTTKMLDEIDSVKADLGDTPKFQKYKKEKENAVIAQYKPVVKNMTYSQGKVIVLLINRESGRPCYDVIKQLRGGVQAMFWQGVAKLFDNNLKRTYEPAHRDREVEDIVLDILDGIPY